MGLKPVPSVSLTAHLRFFKAISAAGLTRNEKLFLLTLLNWADEHGVAEPSILTVAHVSGMSKTAAYAASASLRAKQVLTVLVKSNGGRNAGSRVQIDLATLASLRVHVVPNGQIVAGNPPPIGGFPSKPSKGESVTLQNGLHNPPPIGHELVRELEKKTGVADAAKQGRPFGGGAWK